MAKPTFRTRTQHLVECEGCRVIYEKANAMAWAARHADRCPGRIRCEVTIVFVWEAR